MKKFKLPFIISMTESEEEKQAKTLAKKRRILRTARMLADGMVRVACLRAGICTRCKNPARPLETQTFCAKCAEYVRQYQREYWFRRPEKERRRKR